jgi:two-component system chemotaxis response regulator CheB
MTFSNGTLRIDRGPKIHSTRPAVDPLFQSAARTYGERVVGVVLTGGGDDGVDGLIRIKASGGLSIAQDPDEAMYPFMPRNAVLYDEVDLVLPVREIARALVALADGKTVVGRAA